MNFNEKNFPNLLTFLVTKLHNSCIFNYCTILKFSTTKSPPPQFLPD